MPLYKDVICIGMCESFNKACLRPDLFVEVAEKYGAEPKMNKGVIDIERKQIDWIYFNLNIQGDGREDAILAIMEEVKGRNRATKWNDVELRRLAEQSWLTELPCHTECPITICGYCTYQHKRDLISDGTCKVKEAMDREILPISSDLETEDLEPVYVDPRWPTEEKENGNDNDAE